MRHLGFALPFCITAFNEWWTGRRINRLLSSALTNELARRHLKADSREASSEDWEMLSTKLIRFRPRLLGAVAAYTLLTGVRHRALVDQGGLKLFRMMWFLGSSQDDLIDELSPEMTLPESAIRGMIRASIFGKDRTFYRAAFTVFGNELKDADFSDDAKTYLRRKAHVWYSFLVEQEAMVFGTPVSDFTFAFCRTYRENQNRTIGELLTACLNGSRCTEPLMQNFERVIPLLSFRTQIIDDIADIPEDLQMGRPSYCVGALNEFPSELSFMRAFLIANPEIKKMTPELFRSCTPKSFELIESTYERYGRELRARGAPSNFLGTVGDVLFRWFPKIRDGLYRINPNAANF